MSLYLVTDPATGDIVKKYPTATDAEIGTALSDAVTANKTWAREDDRSRARGPRPSRRPAACRARRRTRRDHRA